MIRIVYAKPGEMVEEFGSYEEAVKHYFSTLTASQYEDRFRTWLDETYYPSTILEMNWTREELEDQFFQDYVDEMMNDAFYYYYIKEV